jgi:hypothetical protein
MPGKRMHRFRPLFTVETGWVMAMAAGQHGPVIGKP